MNRTSSIHEILLFALLIPIVVVRSLTCDDEDIATGHVIRLPPTCFYIAHPEHVTETNYEAAENECRLLGEYPYRWHTPKLDDDEKNMYLVELIRNTTGLNDWLIWINLRRDPPISKSEAINVSTWADPSRWAWERDGSTLEASYPSSPPPWIDGEPNNGLYREGGAPSELELCAVAQLEPSRNPTTPKWFDMSCRMAADHFSQELLRLVLVCEASILVDERTVEDDDDGDDPSSQRASSDDNGPYPWNWLFWVMTVLAMALGTCLAGALYHIRKGRQGHESTEMTIGGPTYEHMAGSREWIVEPMDSD